MYTNKVLALDQLVQYSYLQTPFTSLSQFSTYPHTQTHHLASPLCRLPVTRFSTILIFSISSQHGIKELCGPSTPGFRKSKTYLWGEGPGGYSGSKQVGKRVPFTCDLSANLPGVLERERASR